VSNQGETRTNLEIGRIKAIFRYPVKSMAGEQLDSASLGWHGLEGDRRFAFRRVADQSGCPWLTASRLHELILFKPFRPNDGADGESLIHVLTPEGRALELRGEELRAEISRRHGAEVQLMYLNHGIFDEASISLISPGTILKVERESGGQIDIRRFRPNIVIETRRNEPFEEDAWVGRSLVFGEAAGSPAVSITLRDVRCVMINLDPETAEVNPAIMKCVVRLNQNNAGVYGTVIRTGSVFVGQGVYLGRECKSDAS
jgi:MOSC domain-containing protein